MDSCIKYVQQSTVKYIHEEKSMPELGNQHDLGIWGNTVSIYSVLYTQYYVEQYNNAVGSYGVLELNWR